MTDQETIDDWLDVDQAAKKLKVTPRTLFRYIAAGRLVAIKHRNKRWVTPAAITDYVAKLNNTAAKEASTRSRRHSGTTPRRGRGGVSEVA